MKSGADRGDLALLLKALAFAAHKHRDQRRKDAESSPYINHPIALADVLINEGGVTDVEVLCAALLHDTVEDTATTHEELVNAFGSKIARIVAEVTDDKSLPKAERKRLQVEHAASTSTGRGAWSTACAGPIRVSKRRSTPRMRGVRREKIAHGRSSRQSPRLLRRGRARDRDRRARAEPVRRADLRAARDRAQQVRGRGPALERRGARRRARRGADRQHGDLQRPWRGQGGARRGRAAW